MDVLLVSVGLVIQHGHVLMAKRHQDQHLGGLWEFPGGKIEPQETPWQALKREFEEEVSLIINDAQQILELDFQYPERAVRLIVFLVTEFSGQACHREGQEMRWVGVDELSQLTIPAANEPIVNYILQHRKKNSTSDCDCVGLPPL